MNEDTFSEHSALERIKAQQHKKAEAKKEVSALKVGMKGGAYGTTRR